MQAFLSPFTEEAFMAKKSIGMSLPRLEDPALLCGHGRFID
ncbi:MAG: hypothetical protein ACI8W7_002576, partial [Gammaproteobacteria bacterium]